MYTIHHLLLFLPLLTLVLFLFLPWHLALLLYIPILIGCLFVYWKAVQAQHLPPITGKRVMVGDLAVVVTSKNNEIDVNYKGEIWRAFSRQPLQPGQQVIIENVEGLTLRVAPLPPSTDDGCRKKD